MSFLWADSLWALLALPALVAAYVWLLQRRRKLAVRYSSLGVVRAAAAARNWRRHVPPVLLLLACACLVFAAARPVAKVPLPWARTQVILAIDVSLSMRVADVKPTRMAAAQDAAKLFLREVPRNVEVGLLTFAGNSQVVQRATLDRGALATAIDGLQMQFGTAIGDAIVRCLAELFPDEDLDPDEILYGRRLRPRSLDEQPKRTQKEFQPVPPGSYRSGAIVLLSDGRRTTGIETLTAAKMAADHGVRVYVIGLGTVEGTANLPEGMAIYMQLDEPTLREVARMTGGEYHHAATAETLREVYRHLGSRVQVLARETELTSLLALAAALLLLAGGGLSVLWFGRIA